MVQYFLLTMLVVCMAIPVISQAQSCVTAECHVSFSKDGTTHPPERGCLSCHVDGSVDHVQEGRMAPATASDCFSCHDSILKNDFSHKPVTSTTCELCHNPHGSLERFLLPQSYSTKFFVDYTDKAYTLCFSCHDRGLLLFPETSFSTGFRDGVVNLHFSHVNKASRGRSCKLCHSVHGAQQPKLMADTVAFGNWQMPMNFRKMEKGGSCAPGCHEPRQYMRK